MDFPKFGCLLAESVSFTGLIFEPSSLEPNNPLKIVFFEDEDSFCLTSLVLPLLLIFVSIFIESLVKLFNSSSNFVISSISIFDELFLVSRDLSFISNSIPEPKFTEDFDGKKSSVSASFSESLNDNLSSGTLISPISTIVGSISMTSILLN